MTKNKTRATSFLVAAVLVAGVLTFITMQQTASAENGDKEPAQGIISNNAILNGLASGALFPFIDVTPHSISSAHIAITDSTSDCTAGAAAPSNIEVLVGVAGGTLVNVMDSATNTGIGSTTQCVFHVTITPGVGGVPTTVTDIVVVNTGGSALTGINTITASADVTQ